MRICKSEKYPKEFNVRYKELKSWTKQSLKSEVERNYRVIDTRGLTKDDFISLMLDVEGWFSMIKIQGGK